MVGTTPRVEEGAESVPAKYPPRDRESQGNAAHTQAKNAHPFDLARDSFA